MRLLIPFFLLQLIFSCGEHQAPAADSDYRILQGETMGTYYRVVIEEKGRPIRQGSVDSLLEKINVEVSTYIDSSTISRFNRAGEVFVLNHDPDPAGKSNVHFLANYELAKVVFEKTHGAFDPTVMPLVNYWGFGYSGKRKIESVDTAAVDSLIRLVGFDRVSLKSGSADTLLKFHPGIQLDFSACAKGYAVDVVARFLEKQDVQNYLVDIGGEARALGVNAQGKTWTIGINTPREDAAATDILTAIPLNNQSVATSGNYRNFYEVNGLKYSHTINPKTGFPERSRLLSASVFTQDCMAADAYATAFMVMGLENAHAMAEESPNLEAYFIYSDKNGDLQTTYTEGLKPLLEN